MRTSETPTGLDIVAGPGLPVEVRRPRFELFFALTEDGDGIGETVITANTTQQFVVAVRSLDGVGLPKPPDAATVDVTAAPGSGVVSGNPLLGPCGRPNVFLGRGAGLFRGWGCLSLPPQFAASVHAAVSDERAAALNAQFVPATLLVRIGERQFVVSFEPERVSLRADSSGSTTEVRILLTSPEGHRFAPGEELLLLARYWYEDALNNGALTPDALNDTDPEGVTMSALGMGISETGDGSIMVAFRGTTQVVTATVGVGRAALRGRLQIDPGPTSEFHNASLVVSTPLEVNVVSDFQSWMCSAVVRVTAGSTTDIQA